MNAAFSRASLGFWAHLANVAGLGFANRTHLCPAPPPCSRLGHASQPGRIADLTSRA